MNFSFIFVSLFIVSVLTTLTVQGIKRVLDTQSVNYSSNILAVIVSVALSALLSVGYVIYTNTYFTSQIIIETVVLMYFSFLVATNGYDKVVQAIKQIENLGKGE
jgi:hypothetical protein